MRILIYALFILTFSTNGFAAKTTKKTARNTTRNTTEKPPRFTVVAGLEDSGTSLYDFKNRAFRTNPIKKRKNVDLTDEKKVTAKACEVSKHIGNKVWVVKMHGGNTTTCTGTECCGPK